MGILVGFDGGWTKTALALCSEDGRVLARTRGPGTAIVGLPTENFFAVADALLGETCRLAAVRRADIAHVVMGLSGVDFEDEQLAQHASIAAGLRLNPARLSLVNDGIAALCGASRAERLAIVQHGSGITLAWRDQPGDEQVFDSLDVGAVFDIRREAVIRVTRMIDGRAEPTPLLDRVLQHCDVPAPRFAEWIWRDPTSKARQATLAAVVYDAWRAGDPAATELVQCAAHDYVLAAKAMGHRMDSAVFAAAFGGGVIVEGGAEFQRLLEDRLSSSCPSARLTPVALPPDAGALVIAARRVGIDATALFDRLLTRWGDA